VAAMAWTDMTALKVEQGDLRGSHASTKKSLNVQEKVLGPHCHETCLSRLLFDKFNQVLGDPSEEAPLVEFLQRMALRHEDKPTCIVTPANV